MSYQLVPTADGSLSCVDDVIGQLCHNRAGAYTEAVNNYVRPSRLLEKAENTSTLTVLDACYGMGYNTWALVNELAIIHQCSESAIKKPFTLTVVAIESSLEIVRFLPQVLAHSSFHILNKITAPSEHNIYYRTFMDMFDTKGVGHPITLCVADGVTLNFTLWLDDLRHRIPLIVGDFDAVFHDPFSPQKMPELWTVDLFQHYQRLLKNRQGALLTYSTAAAVQGGLREAGFQVLKTKGLGRKAGSTVALTSNADVTQFYAQSIALDAWEEEYLESRAAIPYRDETLSAPAASILAQRELEQSNSARPSGASALKKKPTFATPFEVSEKASDSSEHA